MTNFVTRCLRCLSGSDDPLFRVDTRAIEHYDPYK